MKIKLVNAEYIPSSGVSYAVIKTKYGMFSGKARLHPDDKEKASNYIGCEYAEARATAKALKAELKEKRLILKEFENFEKRMKGYKNYNPYSFEMSKLRKKIYELRAEVEDLKKTINGVENTIKKTDISRQNFLERFNKDKEN